MLLAMALALTVDALVIALALAADILALLAIDIALLGGAMIKSPKILYCPFDFFHLGSLGIYIDKMDPNFQTKKYQKCPIGSADDYCTGFC